ncbi:MAG TPA: hypothetical protein VF121_04520 [Thermoanaerobaculia bacterium]|nr:hypothetical protein [Thermoanaerobaculia bacterium]
MAVNELIRYVLENLRSLTAFHLLLILVLTGLATTVMTKFLLRLYQLRYDAQSDLLGLKESMLQELRVRVQERENAVKDIRCELDVARSRTEKAEIEATQQSTRAVELGSAIEALAETGLAFQVAFYQLERIYLLQRFLDSTRDLVFLHFTLATLHRQDRGRATKLHGKLNEVRRRFDPLDKEIPTLPLPSPGRFKKGVQPPKEIVHFPFAVVEEEINAVCKEASAQFRNLWQKLSVRRES